MVLILKFAGQFWRTNWFWFTLIHNSFGFLFILICDSIWFYSFWFDLILIRRESRITRESWFTCKSKIKSNQKSKVYEFTHCRIIGWFDFESKANQSESRIKLVRTLSLTVYFSELSKFWKFHRFCKIETFQMGPQRAVLRGWSGNLEIASWPICYLIRVPTCQELNF